MLIFLLWEALFGRLTQASLLLDLQIFLHSSPLVFPSCCSFLWPVDGGGDLCFLPSASLEHSSVSWFWLRHFDYVLSFSALGVFGLEVQNPVVKLVPIVCINTHFPWVSEYILLDVFHLPSKATLHLLPHLSAHGKWFAQTVSMGFPDLWLPTEVGRWTVPLGNSRKGRD